VRIPCWRSTFLDRALSSAIDSVAASEAGVGDAHQLAQRRHRGLAIAASTPSAMLKTRSTGESMSRPGQIGSGLKGQHDVAVSSRAPDRWPRWSQGRRTRPRRPSPPLESTRLHVVGEADAQRLGRPPAPTHLRDGQSLPSRRTGHHRAQGGLVVKPLARRRGKGAGPAFQRRQGVDLKQIDPAVVAQPKSTRPRSRTPRVRMASLQMARRRTHHVSLQGRRGQAHRNPGWPRRTSAGSHRC